MKVKQDGICTIHGRKGCFHEFENMKQKNEEWEKDFDLLWGLAPEGTLKHDKGKEVKKFIEKLLARREEEVKREMLEEIEVMGDVTESRLLVDGKDWIEYKKALLDTKEKNTFEEQEKLVEDYFWVVTEDDETGKKYWSGRCDSDMNRTDFDKDEPLRLDPNHFPVGYTVRGFDKKIKEQE